MQRSRFFHFIRYGGEDVEKLKEFIKHPDVVHYAVAHHVKTENYREHWHFCFQLKFHYCANEMNIKTGISIEDHDFSKSFSYDKQYLLYRNRPADTLVINGRKM